MKKFLLIALVVGGLTLMGRPRCDAQVYFSVGYGLPGYRYYPYGYYYPYPSYYQYRSYYYYQPYYSGYYYRPYYSHGAHRYYRHHHHYNYHD